MEMHLLRRGLVDAPTRYIDSKATDPRGRGPAWRGAVDSELLEQLLHQPESQFLDFKEAQYPFVKASDIEKSELLKDILAFGNSWRHTSAYVLIGVREVKGGRGEVVGVGNHLEDASLHQFVNSKTQRRVELAYEVFATEGVEIGVIEIPLQERPIYIRHMFGKVEAEAVYIRDGSSTRKASPDEVAKMGAQQSAEATPRLELSWADIGKHSAIPSPYLANTLLLHPRLPANTFGLPERRRGLIAPLGPTLNPRYSEEIIDYAVQQALLVPLGLLVQNVSRSAARRVRFFGSIPVSDTVTVNEYLDPLPQREYSWIPDVDALTTRTWDEVEARVQRLSDRWEISVEFGDIRPRDSVYTSDPIWICAAESAIVELTGHLFGDNIPEPIPYSLETRFQVETRPMEYRDVLPYLRH